MVKGFSQFQHILIPLDFTERNDVALSTVRDIAEESKAHVTLIHIVEPIDDAEDEEAKAFTQNLTNEAENHLRERADKLQDLDITVTCENRVGKRNTEIVTYAMDQDVDLILLNSHPITPESGDQNNLGLSYQIALLAPCAVLMLKS
jgi:universal stress protein A